MASIDKLLELFVEKGASDFHLTTGNKPLLRLHGGLTPMEGAKALPAEVIHKLLDEIMNDEQRAEFESEWDTDFAYEIPGLARFRVNAFRDRLGPGGVFRRIPTKIMSAADLQLPPGVLNFSNLTKGLVLVTGPTGSGKSTTLAAIIDHINQTRNDHIITIEDPIEFVHENKQCLINQRQIGRDTKTYRQALRAALREDPDIVLVGEMRDLETTEIALETAETGHLVFGTLHTNSAIGTIDRIINQFPADRQMQIRMMLAESLKGVVTQVLCKRLDGKGRIAALEILASTPAIANNIREGKNHQIASSMQTGKRFGMQLLNDELFRLAKEKLIDPKEAYLKAADKEDILMKLRTAGLMPPEEKKNP